jgi:uncharacterized protein YidB (DUF937 family)
MGLLDILNGMQNGPRGQRQPAPSGAQSGGMSPIMMALLGLLAYKAIQGGGLGNILGGGGTAPQPAPGRLPGGTTPQPAPGGTTQAGGDIGDLLSGMFGGGSNPSARAPSGGGLGDILGGMLGGNPSARAPSSGFGDVLGGLLGGGAAGGLLNSGLGSLLNDLQNSGQAHAAQSWVGTGTNEAIAPEELGRALGPDTINALAAQTGLSRQDLLAGLSEYLPDLVDQLTPDGRLPTQQEAARW